MKYFSTVILLLVVYGLNAQIFYNSSGTPTNTQSTNPSNTQTTTPSGTTDGDGNKKPAFTIYKQGGSGTTTTTSSPTMRTTTTTTSGSNGFVGGSNIGGDVPPNAEPGKCYARCLIPDQYDWVTKKVVDQPKMFKKVRVPALYSTVYDTVVSRPRSVRTVQVPAEYEEISETVMIAPTTTKWVKGKADAGCLSANPEDCQVMCLVEVPAQYRTVRKKVMKNESYTREIVTPEEIKIIAKQVRIKDEGFMTVEIPETYRTEQDRVIVKKGGYQAWREVLCGDQITSQRIISIQQALKARGYDPGPLDDVFGAQTKAALITYQRDNGLPVGNLNLETLEHLGVR